MQAGNRAALERNNVVHLILFSAGFPRHRSRLRIDRCHFGAVLLGKPRRLCPQFDGLATHCFSAELGLISGFPCSFGRCECLGILRCPIGASRSLSRLVGARIVAALIRVLCIIEPGRAAGTSALALHALTLVPIRATCRQMPVPARVQRHEITQASRKRLSLRVRKPVSRYFNLSAQNPISFGGVAVGDYTSQSLTTTPHIRFIFA